MATSLVVGFAGARFALNVRIQHSLANEGKNEQRILLINPPDDKASRLADDPN